MISFLNLSIAFIVFQALAVSDARFVRGRNLIIGGDEVKNARHPYMISLQDKNSHYCGASLIAPDIVLTAGKYLC